MFVKISINYSKFSLSACRHSHVAGKWSYFSCGFLEMERNGQGNPRCPDSGLRTQTRRLRLSDSGHQESDPEVNPEVEQFLWSAFGDCDTFAVA